MNIALYYRIYPNAEQRVFFAKTFGCCRKVWNLMLGDEKEYYKKTGKFKMNYSCELQRKVSVFERS